MTAPKPGIGVGIVAMAAFLPDEIRTNDWWSGDWASRDEDRGRADVTNSLDEAVDQRDVGVDPEVVRYAAAHARDPFKGSERRRVMAADMRPSDMEAAACRAALAEGGIDPAEVDAILGFSLVRDYVGVEDTGLVAHKVGLREGIGAFEVGAGCASFLHELRTASSLIALGEAETVLVYVSSAASLVMDYSTPSSTVPGDGALAAVVRRVEPGLGYVATNCLTRGDLHGGIHIAPRTQPEAPWWRAERIDSPFVIRRIDGRAAHIAGTKSASLCRETVAPLLERAGYTPEDVAFFVVSQAGPWFARALADAIGIGHDKILSPEEHFLEFGHMMAVSTPMNLMLAHRLGRLRKGDLVLLYSPGVGFTTAATLYRWNLDS